MLFKNEYLIFGSNILDIIPDFNQIVNKTAIISITKVFDPKKGDSVYEIESTVDKPELNSLITEFNEKNTTRIKIIIVRHNRRAAII